MLGIIGRFKPLHKGGALLLQAATNLDYTIIGIGSSNRYNLRNPFTPNETKDMINSVLKNNYKLIEVPDVNNEEKWIQKIKQLFPVDTFITGNKYVEDLLKHDYKIIHPKDIIQNPIEVRATNVRYEMAKKGNWENLVPTRVANYIKQNKLDQRFRKEFGLEALAESGLNYLTTIEQEKQNVMQNEI